MERRWLAWFLYSAITGYALQSQDPDVWCSRKNDTHDTYSIRCHKDKESALILDFRNNGDVAMDCKNSPMWSDHLPKYPDEDVYSVNITRCPFNDTILRETFEKLSFHKNPTGASTLKVLRLNGNILTGVPDDIFKHLPQLVTLNLSNNDLARLPLRIFDGLSQLENLYLNENKMTELQPKLFDDLSSVKLLDISGSNLNVLPADIFEHLGNLTELRMSRNNFSSLPEKLLSENENLESIHLYGNKQNLTTLPRSFLRDLTKLSFVVLCKNGLLSLREDILWGASSLKMIDLNGNYLRTLPEKIFKDLGNLTFLDLSDNSLSRLPEGLFAALGKLMYLILSRNQLNTISGTLLSSLTSLVHLRVNENHMQIIHDNCFTTLGKLRYADFSHNQLTFGREKTSPFRNCTQLYELHLSDNNITTVYDDWLSNENLRFLDLSYNRISTIDVSFNWMDQCQRCLIPFAVIHLIVMNGNENFISICRYLTTNYGKVQVTYILSTTKVTDVDLRHNTISEIAELLPIDIVNPPPPTPVRIYIEDNPIHCDYKFNWFPRYMDETPYMYSSHGRTIISGKLECKSPVWLQGQLVSDLNPLSMPNLVHNTSCDSCCPEECTCWKREFDRTFIVECSYRNISEAPKRIAGLKGYHNIVLNLTGNSLTEIPRVDRNGYENVTMLLLSHNNIRRIDSSILELLNTSKSLRNLTLHENPWRCDCDELHFVIFVKTVLANMTDLLTIHCADLRIPLLDIVESKLCATTNGTFAVVIVTLSLLGIFLAILAAYYKYQREVKVWLHARRLCLWWVNEEDLDKDKLYDAFVSYSNKDEDLVLDELVTNLQEGPRPYKLCLHFRDWFPGESIHAQIVSSVEDSRRTIIVLSRNFLESAWGRMEFRAAHSQALSDGRTRIILVLISDIGPTDNLDSELKVYLNTNTYIRWGDPYFWDRLRYALPHASKIRERSRRDEYTG